MRSNHVLMGWDEIRRYAYLLRYQVHVANPKKESNCFISTTWKKYAKNVLYFAGMYDFTQSYITHKIIEKCIRNMKYGIAFKIYGQMHFDLADVDHYYF